MQHHRKIASSRGEAAGFGPKLVRDGLSFLAHLPQGFNVSALSSLRAVPKLPSW
jgi:hypothetical protein